MGDKPSQPLTNIPWLPVADDASPDHPTGEVLAGAKHLLEASCESRRH